MNSKTDALTEGYRRFRENRWPEERAEYEALAERGQKPHTLVVACSDSRADPALIFDSAPGELFVVRNVANIVPAYQPDGGLHGVSAALEFGVRILEVERIVVMGHAHCSGVGALRSGAPVKCQDFMEPWVAQAAPAVRAVCQTLPEAEHEQAAEEAVVRLSIDNLRTFPWIAEREKRGLLTLTGLHFGIAEGVLSIMRELPRFVPLV